MPAQGRAGAPQADYAAEKNDLTTEVLANLEFLGIDYLVPMGGDDTLSYGVELGRRGFPVVALPKTMDNDVPGTDYCMGFSTCVTRTIELAHQVRSSAASHERIVVLEVFGRYAGFTALLPTHRRRRRPLRHPRVASSTWSVSRSCSSPTATRTRTSTPCVS